MSNSEPAGASQGVAADPPRRRGRPTVRPAIASRDRILSAALEEFAAVGYETASTRRIAARAGLDAALIGRTFGSKFNLWLAVLDGITGKIVPLLDKLGETLSEQAVGTTAEGLVALVCDTPELATLLIAEVIHPNERTRHIVVRVIEPILQAVRELIAAAGPDDQLSESDLQFRAFAIMGSLAILAASRPALVASLPMTADEAQFRAGLKAMMMSQIEAWHPAHSADASQQDIGRPD